MTIALVTKEDSPPCDWVKRSFYDLARITSGQVDPREQPYRSMVLVAPDHIRTGAGRIEERLTADQQGAISGKYLVKQGEIIYSKIRPNLQKLALATEDCLCSADMYPISARDGVSPQFLKYLLLSKPFTEFAISVSVRSGMPKINRQELAHFVIRVPRHREEQEAIAEALSDADALIEGLERLIAKKRLIKQGAMQDLLTAKRRLPGFSGEWALRDIDAVAVILDNLRVPLNDAQRKEIPGSIPYCGANGIVDYVGKHLIDDDVILMAEDGGYFDEFQTRPIAYRMIGKIWVNNHAHVLKARPGFDHGFLFHSLRHKDITPFLASGTRAKLNKSELKKIGIRAPNEEAEQTRIALLLNDMDAEIQALETRLEKARQVKEGMMQNLLTGKIRLV